MQQGRRKICLDPSGSPQSHLHASEQALTSSCFFYQAHRHSKLVRLDSSVNVGYSQCGCCVSPASPVPLSLGRHPPTSTWPWINTARAAPTEPTTWSWRPTARAIAEPTSRFARAKRRDLAKREKPRNGFTLKGKALFFFSFFSFPF